MRALRLPPAPILLALGLLATGCEEEPPDAPVRPTDPTPTYTEERAQCRDRNPQRNLYFGDLHVHTGLSFDAYENDVRTGPADSYAFARGEPLALPPLGADGEGTREAVLERPLDFAAVTDHSEFLGETSLCADPSSAAYDSETCVTLREESDTPFALALAQRRPARFDDVCGPDGAPCLERANRVWRQVRDDAEAAYDRSADCRFTSFVAYEYTNVANGNVAHRNVIFRNAQVPEQPVSFYEEPTPEGLWRRLRDECTEAGTGCDVLAIPHNPNQSAGTMFAPRYAGTEDEDGERAVAALRARMEPLVEIYQHKGASECALGLSGVLGEPDELCGFELLRPPPFPDCGDGTGVAGALGTGCISRRDFVRNALATGLAEQRRLGVNPFQLGIVASTDTHTGTAGATEERGWAGHSGRGDEDPVRRVSAPEGPSTIPDRIRASPGGLAAVWAVENSRDAIFEALRRRETYGTSGTRMSVRFFGGPDLPADLCERGDLLDVAYERAVPMGGELGRSRGGLTFVAMAFRDPGTPERPSAPLQRIQIIKGVATEDGSPLIRVFEIAGDPDNGARVDPQTCERSGPGFDSLCGVWTDPTFDPDERAFYYVRVLENPSCRWSAYVCNAIPEGERPPACDDPSTRTAQERAWTSPIWYVPQ
jgi:hypothetical protein